MNHSRAGKTNQALGFALIATISVMILLVMVALAMLSLTTIETRANRQAEAMQQARANARMALMIALAELQKHMGPDQRVSAWSDILDSSPESDSVDGVKWHHQLGVWDSWNTYITDEMKRKSGGNLKIADTYQPGREALFRRWMFSYPETASLEKMDAVLAAGGLDLNDSNSVQLVADGTLGSSASTDNFVRAGLVDIDDNGALAWWVGGDNLKSALNTHNAVTTTGNSQPDAVQQQLDHTHLNAADPTEAEHFSSFGKAPEKRAKLLTQRQLALNLEQNAANGSLANYFDFTTNSRSLLVDVRRGGVKRDLNILFENDNTPSRFQQYSAGQVTIDAPIRTIEGAVLDSSKQLVNPHTYLPSWRQMREYYRLYRSASDHGIQWDGDKPYTYRYIQNQFSDTRNLSFPTKTEIGHYTRVPLILRYSFVIGLLKEPSPNKPGEIDYAVIIVPVITYWNPYNVELRIGADEFASVMSFNWGLRISHKTYLDGNLVEIPNGGRKDPYGWSPLDAIIRNFGEALNLKATAMRGGSNDSTPGDDIIMKPGEIVMFSVGGNTETSNSKFAEKGYIRGAEKTAGIKAVAFTQPASQNPGQVTFALKLGGRGKAQYNYQMGMHKSSVCVLARHLDDHRGLYDESGNPVSVAPFRHATAGQGKSYGLSLNWYAEHDKQESDLQIPIIQDDPFNRAEWSNTMNEVAPVAIVTILGKVGERISSEQDYRCKNWLHAPVAEAINMLGAPNEISRVNFPYTMHYETLDGNVAFAEAVSVVSSGENFGQSFSGAAASSGNGGVSQIVTQELPTAPLTSLAQFSTMRLRPAALQNINLGSVSGGQSRWAEFANWWRLSSHQSATFGVGIGNGYAHPIIPADKFFHSTSGNQWTHTGHLKPDQGAPEDAEVKFSDQIWNDYWDQLLITNDALWDEWFCSGIVPETQRGNITKSISKVVQDLFKDSKKISNQRIEPFFADGKSAEEIIDELLTDEDRDQVEDGYQKAAAYLLLRGGFNVNSTSVEAWKATLLGLKSRALAYRDVHGNGNPGEIYDSDSILLSRHRWATGDKEASGPEDKAAWTGIRKLTDDQIDKLSKEIVRQVKLRGPFLNMSEFINRRLEDGPLGQAGTLQAAIDWDEFDNGYNGSGSTSAYSINGIFKSSNDMISNPNANGFPNENAAKGSRYAGIPGYVMASDLLQAMGDILTPRDDTFTIRAYGQTKDKNGNVIARAWCEAKVQRIPDYLDPEDRAWESKSDTLGNDLKDTRVQGLNQVNKTFGRKFNIVSFRWLSNKDI